MHDLIDRKAAIDILDAYQVMLENGEENPYSWARFRMSELPSAQQDCTECEEYDHERHYCPKFCDVIRKTADELQVEASCKLPERKTGRWIEYDNSHCECPFCHVEWSYFDNEVECFNYCPNCGARMEGEGC